MKKQLQLIRVMLKCGRVGKSEEKNAAVGDFGQLLTWFIGAAVVVAMFLGGRYAAQHQETLGGASDVFGTLMVTVGIVSFFMTFMTAIGQLYMSSDLDVLVTLPFTPMQIVVAKLTAISALPAGLCFGTVVPGALGYAFTSGNFDPMFLIGAVVGALSLMVFTVSAAAVLLMVIMRVFRFVRSRNLMSVFSTLMVFVLTMAYMVAASNSNDGGEQQAVNIYLKIAAVVKTVGVALPGVSFTLKAMAGDIVSLLVAAGIGAAAAAVMLVCAKYFYFEAALKMTDANGSRGKLGDKEMRKYTASGSPMKTLRRREFANILRTPAMMTNGYLFSILVPLVIIVPMAVKMVGSIQESAAELGQALTLDIVRQLVASADIPAWLILLIGSLAAFFMSSMAVAMSVLSRYMITREGKDFTALKVLPVSMRKLVMMKRNVVLCFNGISGFLIPALVIIAAGVLGFIPAWTAAVCVINAFAWLLAEVDFCALFDVRKPNLNWESEGVMKNNVPGLIVFFASLGMLIASVFVLTGIENPDLNKALGILLAVFPVAAAVPLELALRRAADDL